MQYITLENYKHQQLIDGMMLYALAIHADEIVWHMYQTVQEVRKNFFSQSKE